MIKEEKYNQPAFPSVIPGDSKKGWDAEHLEGMTLRDYFAAKAMPVVAEKQWKSYMSIWQRIRMIWERGNTNIEQYHFLNFRYIAKTSYEMADAMLKERSKDQTLN